MRWFCVPVVVLSLGFSGPREAMAFTMGEAMGTAAIQGTLAGQSSGGAAGVIGGVRQSLNQSVGGYNQRFSAALGGNAPPAGASGSRWIVAGATPVVVASQSWATVEGGIGGTSGWKAAEAFRDTANQAWVTNADGWLGGGLVP